MWKLPEREQTLKLFKTDVNMDFTDINIQYVLEKKQQYMFHVGYEKRVLNPQLWVYTDGRVFRLYAFPGFMHGDKVALEQLREEKQLRLSLLELSRAAVRWPRYSWDDISNSSAFKVLAYLIRVNNRLHDLGTFLSAIQKLKEANLNPVRYIGGIVGRLLGRLNWLDEVLLPNRRGGVSGRGRGGRGRGGGGRGGGRGGGSGGSDRTPGQDDFDRRIYEQREQEQEPRVIRLREDYRDRLPEVPETVSAPAPKYGERQSSRYEAEPPPNNDFAPPLLSEEDREVVSAVQDANAEDQGILPRRRVSFEEKEGTSEGIVIADLPVSQGETEEQRKLSVDHRRYLRNLPPEASMRPQRSIPPQLKRDTFVKEEAYTYTKYQEMSTEDGAWPHISYMNNPEWAEYKRIIENVKKEQQYSKSLEWFGRPLSFYGDGLNVDFIMQMIERLNYRKELLEADLQAIRRNAQNNMEGFGNKHYPAVGGQLYAVPKHPIIMIAENMAVRVHHAKREFVIQADILNRWIIDMPAKMFLGPRPAGPGSQPYYTHAEFAQYLTAHDDIPESNPWPPNQNDLQSMTDFICNPQGRRMQSSMSPLHSSFPKQHGRTLQPGHPDQRLLEREPNYGWQEDRKSFGWSKYLEKNSYIIRPVMLKLSKFMNSLSIQEAATLASFGYLGTPLYVIDSVSRYLKDGYIPRLRLTVWHPFYSEGIVVEYDSGNLMSQQLMALNAVVRRYFGGVCVSNSMFSLMVLPSQVWADKAEWWAANQRATLLEYILSADMSGLRVLTYAHEHKDPDNYGWELGNVGAGSDSPTPRV